MAYQFRTFQELFDAYGDVTHVHHFNAVCLFDFADPAHTAELVAQVNLIKEYFDKLEDAYLNGTAASRAKIKLVTDRLSSVHPEHAMILDRRHPNHDNFARTTVGNNAACRMLSDLHIAIGEEKLVAVLVASVPVPVPGPAPLTGAEVQGLKDMLTPGHLNFNATLSDSTNAVAQNAAILALDVRLQPVARQMIAVRDAAVAALGGLISAQVQGVIDSLTPENAAFNAALANPTDAGHAAALGALPVPLQAVANQVIAVKTATTNAEKLRTDAILAAEQAKVVVEQNKVAALKGAAFNDIMDDTNVDLYIPAVKAAVDAEKLRTNALLAAEQKNVTDQKAATLRQLTAVGSPFHNAIATGEITTLQTNIRSVAKSDYCPYFSMKSALFTGGAIVTAVAIARYYSHSYDR